MKKQEKIVAHTIVTGHVNADFDCLAGIVAAGKLYPDARLVYPGSQEKNLKDFYVRSAMYMHGLVSAKDVDLSAVKKLVVVDTRQKGRIPHVKEVLDNPGLELHIYDHHPASDDDLDGDYTVVKTIGSSAALLSLEIQAKGLALTPEEATVIGLGLFEDTGSLTFHSTTPEDFTAGAWLRSQGMDLRVISDLLTRELTADQVSLLNTLIENAKTHSINNVDVVIAEASVEEYLTDFAILVHKMMDMEYMDVLFAICRMGDRVVLVARSRLPDVDVGRICEFFGGGGHSYAASASIKEKTLNQVKDELFALLFSVVNPEMKVGDFMSRPPIAADTSLTIKEADELMSRYGLKAVPVIVPNTSRCIGVLEHQIADRAVSHGLGDVELEEYMAHKFKALSIDDDLFDAMEIIVGKRQRLVPVLDGEELAGVLTRTDLIHLLVEEPARIPENLLPDRKKERSIGTIMRERLPRKVFSLLRTAGDLADINGFEVYVVGGFVRDLLLNRTNLDVDFVVEGDGIAFAHVLAGELGGRVKAHNKFRTAVVILPNGDRLDVATARLEYYEYPAALPIVQLSSIKMDLFRRDFTINALAVHLNPSSFGRLVDFFGSQQDLKEKLIRVLHSLSFVEDPTRIMRAVRFEQRFGFKIGPQTNRLIQHALKMEFFDKLSGSRILHELQLIFNEKNVKDCIVRLDGYGILRKLHENLKINPKKIQLVEQIEEVVDWYRLLYIDEQDPDVWKIHLMALTVDMDDHSVAEFFERLQLTKRDIRDFFNIRLQVHDCFRSLSQWHSMNGKMSELYFILESMHTEGTLFIMARSSNEEIRRHISQYIARYRFETLDIDGSDLKDMGLQPGPAMGDILRLTLAAMVDGEADTREKQLDFAWQLVEEQLEK